MYLHFASNFIPRNKKIKLTRGLNTIILLLSIAKVLHITIL